ncbi:hypothetical protein EV182_001255, partial [Spiromyces aspiralis]
MGFQRSLFRHMDPAKDAAAKPIEQQQGGDLSGGDDSTPIPDLQSTSEAQSQQNILGNVKDPAEYDSDSSLSSSSAEENSSDPNTGVMQEEFDDGDDDEFIMDAGNIPRSKHEVVDPEVPKLDITHIPDNMRMVPLGAVHSIVEKTVVVESFMDGKMQILGEGSVVAFEDRRILGTIFEVFGPVSQPLYSIRFGSVDDIDKDACQVGTRVDYTPDQSRFVSTEEIRRIRATDASNMYDEEIDEMEQEFSDDEEEA